jgi:transposase-like protein
MRSPFKYFNSSPEVIRLAVMMYVRYPLSLRNVEDLLSERRIDICHETVRLWWNRFGPLFAAEIEKRRILMPHGCLEGRWINNRAENSHQPLRRRERAMLRFRRMKTLQKFAAVHGTIHNHFNQERHLTSREVYKRNCSGALAEWKLLLA